jgi:hypothetical protein
MGSPVSVTLVIGRYGSESPPAAGSEISTPGWAIAAYGRGIQFAPVGLNLLAWRDHSKRWFAGPPPSQPQYERIAIAFDRASARDAEDAALLARIAGGDRAAFESLYRAYFARLGRFLQRMLRRPR